MKLVLEPRFLFDGSVSEAVGRGSDHDHQTEAGHAIFHADADHAAAGTELGGDIHSGASVPVEAHAAAVSNTGATQLLFVDPRVANWQQLIKDVASDVQIVVIDTARNGIDQVSAALAGRQNLAGLQFLTNGSPGAIELGSGTVTAASLMAQSDAVTAWADHLAGHAGIALWGSEVGNGNAGAAFLADLHTLTGADIGASTHAVGSGVMGANWQLDAKLGAFDLASPFSAAALSGVPAEILTAIPALATNMAATDLIFIDPRVAGWDQLAAGADANAQVILIDPSRDAVGQITAALEGRTGITAINLVAYGSAGALDIGLTPLSAALVAANADQIASWSGHLAAGADINLWGCDVAQGDGRALLAGLASLTGADVAASTDLVGNADFGGVWTLNTATGPIEAAVPFSVTARANFTNILDPADLTVTMTADKATVQSGDTITYTIVVANPSSHLTDDTGRTLSVTLSSNLTQVGGVTLVGGTAAAATLTPGSTSTFQVQALVKDNLPARTPLISSANVLYTGTLNDGTADDGTTTSISSISSVASFASSISLVGESNGNTAGVASATPQTAISATIGDIVRVHAFVQVPEGQNPNTILDVTLPSGLAFQNDATVKISFASPDQLLKSSTLDATGTSAAQVSEGGGAINPTTFAATTALGTLSGNIDTSTAGHVKFNLGTLTNNAHSATANFILIDFNAIVQNIAGNVASPATSFNLSANIASTAAAGTADSITYAINFPSTLTELSAANATQNLPLFDQSLGTLNSASLSLFGGLVTNGTLTNTGATSVRVRGGTDSIWNVSSPLLTIPAALTVELSSLTARVTIPVGSTSPINNLTASAEITGVAVTTGLAAYQTTTPGATDAISLTSSTADVLSVSGGNAIITRTTTGSGTISVTYNFTNQVSSSVTSTAVTITVVEPRLTLAKTVTAVDPTTGAITFRNVITNTGNATAFGATLNDPEASSNAGAISGLTVTGAATGAGGTGSPSFTTTGGNTVTGVYALAPGASATITYTVAVTDRTAALPNSTATVNWNSLNGGQQTAFGTTNGVVGSATGSRTDPVTGSGLASINTYTANVTLGFGAVSGRVWDELGPFNTGYLASGDIDTAAGIVPITISATGLDPNNPLLAKTATTTTNAAGQYAFSPGVFGNGAVTVTLPTPGTGGLGPTETLVYNASGSVTANPATTTGVTIAIGTANTGLNFIYQKPDVTPVINGWSGVAPVVETGSAPVLLKGTGVSGDVTSNPINTLGGNYFGTILTVQRAGGANAADVFSGDGTLNLVAGTGAVTLSGTQIGTFTQAGGALVITFNTAATITAAQAAGVIDHLQYNNTNPNLLQNGVVINASLNDHNTTSYAVAPGQAGSPGFNLGTGGALTSNIIPSTINIAPAALSVTFTKPNDLPPATNAVTLNSTLAVSIVPDTVTLAITAGFRTGEDTLTVASSALGTKIQASYNATTGVMTLTKVAGQTPTATDWQTALQGVQYIDTNPIPNLPARTVTGTYTAGGVVTTSTETVNLVDLDSSPILGAGAATLGSTNTLSTAVPVGAVGTLVSSLLTQVGVTDPDGNSQTNGGTPATGGLSVVAVDTSKGNWWYSTNGGTTWTQFAGGALPAISAVNSLHLVGDATTRVYFQPNIGATAGTLPTALTFRAWDQFDAVGSGTLSAIPSTGTLGGPSATAPNFLAFSYSSTTAVVPITLFTPGGALTGRTWDRLGPAASVAFGAPGDVDTALAGISVSATGPKPDGSAGTVTAVTTTDASGNYSFAAGTFGTGTVTVTMPVKGAGGLPASETLVYDAFGTVPANPGTAAVTLTIADTTGVNFIYEKPDVAPVLGGWGGTNIQETGSTPVSLKGLGATVADTPLTTLGGIGGADYGGTILTVARTGGANGADSFSGDATLTLSAGVVKLGATTIGSFTQPIGSGSLVVTFATGVTSAQVAAVLDHLQYANANLNLVQNGISISASLNDHNTTAYSAAPGSIAGSPGFNLGTGGALNSNIVIATINVVPSLTAVTFTKPNDLVPAINAVALDGTLVVTTAPDTVTLQITGNYRNGEDTLSVPTAALGGVLTASFTATTGTLTLSVAFGFDPTPTQWQTALRAVQFIDSNPIPNMPARTVTASFIKGPTTTTSTETVNVVDLDSSPILGAGAATLGSTGTFSNAVPTGAVGTLVSSLLTQVGVTDPDGNSQTNGGTPITGGLSVVAVDTSKGSWWYSTNGGTSWTRFAGGALPAISATNSLHLVGDASTRVYFQPNVGATAGTLPTALTFRAWDRYDAVANGALSAIPADGVLGGPSATGPNALAFSYSSTTAVVPITLVAPTGSIAGRVWDVLGPASLTRGAPGDVVTDLAGITVTASSVSGGVTRTATTTTAVDGTYIFAAGTLPDGAVTITLPIPGSAGLGATETLVLQQIGTVGAGAATSTVTLAGAAVSNVNFIYEKPDIAPVIVGWGGTSIPESGSTPILLKGLGATVADAPINTLGGNYGGTILTIARTGAPVGTDVFAGSGTLTLAAGVVKLGGTTIGTFTQSGGRLVVTFATGTTAAQAAAFLDNVTYSNTLPVGTLGQTASITASLNDNNTTLYTGVDPGSVGRNLGVNGPLSGSAVATVALAPAGSISGRVWDNLGPASLTYGAPGDVNTNLGGLTVTATYFISPGVSGVIQTVTAADGTYGFAPGSLPDVQVIITVQSPGGNETLVLQQFGGVGSGIATSTLTLAGAPITNVNFIFEKPDIAPMIANWGGTNIAESGTTPVLLKGLGATVTDVPINTLGGNYGGTQLTVARTGGNIATDLFGGDGVLTLSPGGTGGAFLNGTQVATYVQANGSIGINFFFGATATQVASVLDHLTYSNTAPVTTLGQTASITASLNDNNTTLYTMLDRNSAGRNLGVNGPLTGSAVATVALAPAGSITGRVWDVLGPASLIRGAPGDVVTDLGGITVTASFVSGGITRTVTTTTTPDGTYSFAAGTLPDGPITITLPAPGSAGLSAAESLVLQQIGTVGTGPATSVINLSGGPVANVNFIYEKPDIAPVISGWGGTNIIETGSTPVPLKGLGAGVGDIPIDALGGNYGGTVLTVQRTTGPNATDLFGGDASLLITGGTVTLGNTLIGTFTQSGGSLVITFATNITAPQIASVLDHLTYVSTTPDAVAGTRVIIGASLNDHNTTSYGGTSPGFNLGTGGPVISNLVTATILINPLPPQVPILTPPLPAELPDPIEKFGFGSANRNLIQDRPGRPENWLVGSDVRRFIIANQRSVEPLPPDMFYDTDPSSQLTLNAVQTDGRPLPDWLIFDSRARVFYGTPPSSFHGRVDIAIAATDEQGHRAQGEYRILVGRDLAELQKLLEPPRGERPLPRLDAMMETVDAPRLLATGDAQAENQVDMAVARDDRAPNAAGHENAVDTTSFFAALTQQSNAGGARAGFSQQLRDAGRSGRLGQARALLRTLDPPDARRPAA